MKYIGMPFGMWIIFRGSFERNLSAVFAIQPADARTVMAKAKKKYRKIIAQLPEFEKGDRFRMNLVNAALLASVVLSMPARPDVDKLTVYYRNAMMTGATKWFCRQSDRNKFTLKDLAAMRQTAAFRAADRNPYSWNMEFLPYADDSGYEARFTKCGICTLMQELGLFDLVPAMCALDYAMSEAGGESDFVRACTLANGDPYCDCGYKKK